MKIGIVGSGMIVNDLLIALKELPQIQVTSLCVRPQSIQKGNSLADLHGIKYVYTDYNQFLEHGRFDFVYIGIVNHLHYRYVKSALEANRNVIAEKPFTSESHQTKELISIAKERKLFLFEAVSLLHMPNFAKMQSLLPLIGPIKIIQANFSQYSSRYDKYLKGEVAPVFDPKMAGGALYDINIYNINLIAGLFGSPKTVSYFPNIGFNGIDTSGVAILTYGGFQAVCIGAKDSNGENNCCIQGELGSLKSLGSPNQLEEIELIIHGQEPQRFRCNTYSHRLAHEFEDFARIYAARDYESCQHYLDISAQVADIVEKARNMSGLSSVKV